MNYSLIDIGSNSIRLTVYEIDGSIFKPLFHSKIMAGLAGYVENEKLSAEGIQVAKSALLEFRNIMRSLSVEEVSVFATASLRNIRNTDKVVKLLNKKTGFNIEVIAAEDEALLSYHGSKLELPEITDGAFIDVGGASTEIISFSDNTPTEVASYRLGSLNLYKKNVRKIIPTAKELSTISNFIMSELQKNTAFSFTPHSPLICVGGTGRAVMKIARKLYFLPDECNTLTSSQVEELFTLLTSNRKRPTRLILRMCPDRIHTIIPGLSIMVNIIHLYHAEEIIISNYGIREGYLCRKIIQSNTTTTSLHKTEN